MDGIFRCVMVLKGSGGKGFFKNRFVRVSSLVLTSGPDIVAQILHHTSKFQEYFSSSMTTNILGKGDFDEEELNATFPMLPSKFGGLGRCTEE